MIYYFVVVKELNFNLDSNGKNKEKKYSRES